MLLLLLLLLLLLRLSASPSSAEGRVGRLRSLLLLLLLLRLWLLTLGVIRTSRTVCRLRRFLPGVKSLPDGGVGERGRRLRGELVALRGEHGQRSAAQARMVLEGRGEGTERVSHAAGN